MTSPSHTMIDADDTREEIEGQNVQHVRQLMGIFMRVYHNVGRDVGLAVTMSAVISSAINFLLMYSAVEDVEATLKALIPELPAMDKTLQDQLLLSQVEGMTPQ
jgi:hypothetical protein